MGGQMRHLFSGMFAIDLTCQEEVKYRSVHFGVTMDQLAEAAEQTNNQSVNGLRLKLRTWAISATNFRKIKLQKNQRCEATGLPGQMVWEYIRQRQKALRVR
jgi:hypothetical protein